VNRLDQKVVVITTGGTIAMSQSDETEGVKPEDPAALQDTLPLLNKYAKVEMDHFLNLPSPHITPAIMAQIAGRAKHFLEQNDVAGVVITHGTDTLEETAYFLSLVLPQDKPVVITGAMRSQNELGADGPYNLVNAVRVASDKKAKGMGTLVVFNDEIHSPKTVTKTHTSNVATFQSPGLGPLGMITKKEILFQRQAVSEKQLPLNPPSHQVALIKAVSGMDSSMIEWAIEQNMDGLVIEALGQGNLPPMMLPGIRKALSRNMPVVLVSRCFNGVVLDTYEYEGGGKQLKEMGLLFCNGINGPKARIKLMLALQQTTDPKKLESYFQM
jgi:L-asparaginase